MSSGLSMANVNKIKQMAERHEYNLAIDILDSQNLERSLNPQFLRSCAEIYENVGRNKEARQLYVKAHSMAPEGNKIIFSIINFYLKQGYKDLAKRYFEEYESNDVTGGQQLTDTEYIMKKASGAELSVLFDMLYPYYRDNLDEDWTFELFLLSYLMDKKDDYDIISSDYLATFKDGYYTQTIRDILAGSESAEKLFYIYSEEEVPDTNPEEEEIRAFEKDVLKADYNRHNPDVSEAVITEMVDGTSGASKFFGGIRKGNKSNDDTNDIELSDASSESDPSENGDETSSDGVGSSVEKGLKAFIKRKFGKGEKPEDADKKDEDNKLADKKDAENKSDDNKPADEKVSETDAVSAAQETADAKTDTTETVNADALFGAGEPAGEEAQNITSQGPADFDSSLIKDEQPEEHEEAKPEEKAAAAGTSKADMKEIKPEREFISYDFDDGFAPESESIMDLEEEEEEVFENPFDSISAYKEFERTKNEYKPEYRNEYASDDSVIEPEPEEEYEEEYEGETEGYASVPQIEAEASYEEEESFEAESEYEEEEAFEPETEYEEEETFESEPEYEAEAEVEAEPEIEAVSSYEEETSFEPETSYEEETSFEPEASYEEEEAFEAEAETETFEEETSSYENETEYDYRSDNGYESDYGKTSESEEEKSEEKPKSSYETYADFIAKYDIQYKNEYEAEYKSDSSYKIDPTFELDSEFETEESADETENAAEEARLSEEAEFIGEEPETAETEFAAVEETTEEPETENVEETVAEPEAVEEPAVEAEPETVEEVTETVEEVTETVEETSEGPEVEVEGEAVEQPAEEEPKKDMRSWLKSFFGFDKQEKEEEKMEIPLPSREEEENEKEELSSNIAEDIKEEFTELASEANDVDHSLFEEEPDEVATEKVHVEESHVEETHVEEPVKEEPKTSYKLVNDNPYAGMFAGYNKTSFSSGFKPEPEIEEPIFEAPESKISFNIKSEPVKEAVEEKVEEPAETFFEETVEEKAEEFFEEPVEETYEKPIEETFEEQIEEQVEQPIEEHVEETVEKEDDSLLPSGLDSYDYGVSKSFDFPEFKTDLFPSLMKNEEVIENTFDEVAQKQKEELNARLQEEEKKMREAEELLASLGIKL